MTCGHHTANDGTARICDRPLAPLDTGLGEHIDRAVPLYPDRPIPDGHWSMR